MLLLGELEGDEEVGPRHGVDGQEDEQAHHRGEEPDDDGAAGLLLFLQSSWTVQFNSILCFVSHRAIQFILIFKLSTASINCTKCHVVFILIIHDIVFGNMHVLWK